MNTGPFQPPQNPPQQQPGQPPTWYPPNQGWPTPPQPPYAQPPNGQSQWGPPLPYQQQAPPPFQHPYPPPQRNRRTWLWIVLGIIILVAVIGNLPIHNSSSPSADTTSAPTSSAPTVNSAPTQVPTQAPTQTPAQTEKAYKASTIHTTVATLDKYGNNDSGKEVHFTAIIASFVKDDNGNTAGANVTDPDYSAFVQVAFPAGTDLSHLNKGDTLEVWGTDEGTFSGTNAFGATITEVGIAAQYMTDHTTGYHTG